MQAQTQAQPPTPHKQIRALHDSTAITVYQAYSSTIASAAVAAQKLNASPAFRTGTRMTWIKPSWAWMLYRAGYSYKDARQERILALRMTRADFVRLLERGVLTTHAHVPAAAAAAAAAAVDVAGDENSLGPESEAGEVAGVAAGEAKVKEKTNDVKVQWDPERSVRLDKLDYRSIQIGIPAGLCERWVEEMIVSIEDVTERARELKRVLDERPEVTGEELVQMGLVPVERPFDVPEELQRALGMV